MTNVVVIGAGVAGLACAQRLARAGLQPLLLDKGRQVGGRVATRRAEGLQFDHGAQYVTARGAGFSAKLQRLVDAGAVELWQDGSGRSRFVGKPRMAALARRLGAGLEVRNETKVIRVTRLTEGWLLRMGDSEIMADRVVVTVPAPQVAALLGEDHPLVRELAPVRMAPCLTLMAGVRAPAPFVSREDPDAPLAWIAQDSSKPGRPAGDTVAWVAQASPAFSAAHLEKEPAGIAALMLPMLVDRLGVTLGRVSLVATHRWRHARVTTPLGQPFLRNADATLYLGGDWCIGPRIEAAWTSGHAIAEDLLAQLA